MNGMGIASRIFLFFYFASLNNSSNNQGSFSSNFCIFLPLLNGVQKGEHNIQENDFSVPTKVLSTNYTVFIFSVLYSFIQNCIYGSCSLYFLKLIFLNAEKIFIGMIKLT